MAPPSQECPRRDFTHRKAIRQALIQTTGKGRAIVWRGRLDGVTKPTSSIRNARGRSRLFGRQPRRQIPIASQDSLDVPMFRRSPGEAAAGALRFAGVSALHATRTSIGTVNPVVHV